MGFISYMKGLINKLFAIKDIKTALNVDAAISQEMLNKIDEWQKCYSGRAPWLTDDIHSLRLEQSIVREFANIALNEMSVNITNEKLNNIFKNAVRDLNVNLQEGLATGAMIIKPLGEDKVQYVCQNAFIPIEFDSRGRLLKVIFPEFKQIGDNNFYTRLEYHSLDSENGLTITNKAYYSATKGNLGREVPLESVDEWKNIESTIRYPLMKRQAFGYYCNPIKNTIDGSHCGVSIFDCALELIKKTDVQFGRLDWEFESGERVIHVDIAALRNGDTLPKLNKRLYKGLDLDNGNSELFKEFSPDFREQSIISGLEEYKRNIEFEVGLSYGDISNPQTVDKTATEIKSSKKRKYNTVTAIQNNLRDCLDDLVYALAFFNSMTEQKYEFICDFKDSILVDEETERQQDRVDMQMGIMRPEEYRAKWYGESVDEALKNLPQSAEVIE